MVLDNRALKCIEINKEIILLRQPVRKARIYVVSKLTREAKRLRTKRGDEKQLEKNKRKADKLGREVVALKKVKDDDITRYGILCFDTLQKTSQDPSIPDAIRIIAKVANHKTLVSKLREFKEKYPDYENYVSNKKKAKLLGNQPSENSPKSKSTTKPQAAQSIVIESESENEDKYDSQDDDAAEDQSIGKNASEEDTEIDSDNDSTSIPDDGRMGSDNNTNVDVSTSSEDIKPNSQINTNSADPIIKKTPVNSKKSEKVFENKEKVSNFKRKADVSLEKDVSPMKKKDVKIISKEATVKRFTEILQEDNTDDRNHDEGESVEPPNKNTEIGNTVIDDFFMSADGQTGHLVIAPSEVPEDDNIRWKSEPKDRYFSKNTHKKQFPKQPATKNNKWEIAPKRKGNWNETDKVPQYKKQKSLLQPDYLKKTHAPEKSKMKKNDNFKNTSVPEHLHPSWEAKRKQQEIMKQGFQGKKIVFDND